MEAPQWRLDQLKLLREKEDESYEIQQQDLLDYAEHIGIRLPEEEYLLNFAREGLLAKLPPEWQAYSCPDQSTVYRNSLTGQLSYEHPLDEVYRQCIIQARLDQSRSQGTSKIGESQSQLSDITEEEGEIANDSDVYERYKGSNGLDNLRKPITEEGIKQINEAHHNRETSKITQNSALDRNISIDQSDTISKKDITSNMLLPSSLLQNYKSLQNHSFEQYHTEITQKVENISKQESQYSNSLSNELKTDEIKLKKEVQDAIQKVKKQEKLKGELLKNLEKTNSKLFDQVRKKINHRRFKKKTHGHNKQ